VDLVYLDPPFFTQKNHKLQNRDSCKEYAYNDSWDSVDDYILFIRERLIECRRVLKDSGSIFLHCDRSASHYLRVALDEVFGMDEFQSEIIWSYRRWSNSKKGLLNNHQNILFYSKTKNFKFNTMYTDYSPTTNVDQILVDRKRNERSKTVYKVDDDGVPVIGKEKRGVPLSDVWNIPYLNPKAKERIGYPTQKPVLLLEQIIKTATDEGDMVLDPFCGSGTTLVASALLNRKYIGIDISEDAVLLSNQRLEDMIVTESNLLKVGEEQYKNKSNEELVILNSLDATIVQRNNGIDGFLKEYVNGKPVPIKIQKCSERLDSSIHLLSAAMEKKYAEYGIVVRTHEDSMLFVDEPAVPENILVIDRYDIKIINWLEKKKSELIDVAS
jgi:site-specific DNA-methyltransferase (adenine-specific)